MAQWTEHKIRIAHFLQIKLASSQAATLRIFLREILLWSTYVKNLNSGHTNDRFRIEEKIPAPGGI